MGVIAWLGRYLRPLAWATLVANTVLVVTGGAVRLTGSGLGCPTWPRCTSSSFTPHGALDVHSAIEFGNRLLTFVLVAIAVATFLAAWSSLRRDVRLLAFVLALGIPAQAIIGGITVLTDLNPWVVSFHLLCSLAMIGLSVLFLHRLAGPASCCLPWAVGCSGLGGVRLGVGRAVPRHRRHRLRSARRRQGRRAQRPGPAPGQPAPRRLRVLVPRPDCAGLYFAVRAAGLSLRPLHVLLVVIVLQGAIGFVQYATDVPIVLVGFHMLGAAFVSASVTWVLLSVREPAAPVVEEVAQRPSRDPVRRTLPGSGVS